MVGVAITPQKGFYRGVYCPHAVYRFVAGVLMLDNDYLLFTVMTRFLHDIKGGDHMAIKDYWIYQKREVQLPWALYIVKEFDRRYPQETTCLDFTLYHENIPNQAHSVSKIGLHYDTVSAYISDIALTITDESGMPFTSADKDQLERELLRILKD